MNELMAVINWKYSPEAKDFAKLYEDSNAKFYDEGECL